METNYWTYFLLTLIVLFAFLGIYYSIYANRALMRKKGYSAEYIKVMRKDILGTVLGIGVVVPILLIFSAYLVSLIHGQLDFSAGNQLFLFSIFFILLVTPFVLISYFQSKRKYKKLAIDTGQTITIDFNYKVLHRMFNPSFELPVTIIYTIVLILLVKNFHPAFIHLILLWLLYGMARGSKFQVKPAMKDSYIYVFVFLTINQLLLIYYMAREIISAYGSVSKAISIIGIVLIFIMLVKQLYYFTKLPVMSRELSGE